MKFKTRKQKKVQNQLSSKENLWHGINFEDSALNAGNGFSELFVDSKNEQSLLSNGP